MPAVPADSSYLEEIMQYIARAIATPLPEDVAIAARGHLLDTIAACVSGARLTPGLEGIRFATATPSAPQCQVIGSAHRVSMDHAALANGMSAHADETDDSHELSLTHPGCSVVPAALAAGELTDASGAALLRAVALGYDIAARVSRATWPTPEARYAQVHATTAIAGAFGATASIAALKALSHQQVGAALGYVSHLAGGLKTWLRDRSHIEKAFVFGGLPASNAVRAVALAEAGWPAVDPFQGTPNFFEAFGDGAQPEILTKALGVDFAITQTNIKAYCVGSPIQAPLQGLFEIRDFLGDTAISRVEVLLPAHIASVVADRDMPNISLPYLISAALEDGALSYQAAHDEERFARWQERGNNRVTTGIGHDLPMRRHAIVRVTDTTGATHERRVTEVKGTRERPMIFAEIADKARELCEPVLGTNPTSSLIALCESLGERGTSRELTALLSASA